jgi:hypothetical protein
MKITHLIKNKEKGNDGKHNDQTRPIKLING